MENDVERLKVALEKLLSRTQVGPLEVIKEIFSNWPEIAGKEIAKFSKPYTILDGVLTLETEDPGWASQAKYLTPLVISKLEERFQGQAPRVVKVVVRRPKNDF
ncbi:MAG: DUF721 domain-containing protein [Acidimicrobiales bacterium]|nr:DUF721 domain-containing protein [Acidimicrobiales bacterium]